MKANDDINVMPIVEEKPKTNREPGSAAAPRTSPDEPALMNQVREDTGQRISEPLAITNVLAREGVYENPNL